MRIAFLIIMVFPHLASACLFSTGVESFVADQPKFERKFENELYAVLPEPKVSVLKITRGTVAPGHTCDDAGTITLEVEWPESSVYKLEEIGFYFRVNNKRLPGRIFPGNPVISTRVKENVVKFMFVWLDGHPNQQKDLDFELEVFAVNKGLELGMPSTVKVKYDKG